LSASSKPASSSQRNWAAQLAPYTRASRARALLDLATSVVPYLGLLVAMYLALDVSYWLTLALAVPAAGFLLRTFIVFHDCTHGSFWPERRVNNAIGVLCALLVMQPYRRWRHHHAVHHGSAGDLDRRGTGDVHTLTAAEYLASPWRARLAYRLFRNPLVMFGLGPIWALVLQPRLISRSEPRAMRRSALLTNLAVAAFVAAACLLIGWREYLLIQAPVVVLAGIAGVFLFYVQHQFEDVYWESGERWDYAEAALKGSSYLRLPQPLQFFTGNIGLHHVHHLSTRIPNYNLQRAHDENEVFHDVPVLTLRDGLRSLRLKVFDEESGRMIGWRELRRHRAPTAAPDIANA
jgi:omega-6 fatty acid desaturase (delta-12 desaturase)